MSWKGFRYARRGRWRRDLLAVTEQLLTLAESDMPLREGLEAVSLEAPNRRVEAMLLILAESVNQGMRLSESMARHPGFYPAYYVDVVRAGEDGGRLSESLATLWGELKSAFDMSNAITLYGAQFLFLFSVELLVFGLLLSAVVPQFEQIIAEVEATPTRGFENLMAISEYSGRISTWLIAAALIAGLWYAWRRFPDWLDRSAALSRACSYVPGIGGMVAKWSLARAASVIWLLASAGWPFEAAIRRGGESRVNVRYAAALRRAGERLEGGAQIDAAFETERAILPASFRGLVAAGASGGRLPEAMSRIAELYRADVVKTSRILADVLSPLLLIVAGSIVYQMYSAIFSTLSSFYLTTLQEIQPVIPQ